MITIQDQASNLSIEQLSFCVGGSIKPISTKLLVAEDKWGDTMSHEDWMDYMLRAVPGGADPHDFPGGR